MNNLIFLVGTFYENVIREHFLKDNCRFPGKIKIFKTLESPPFDVSQQCTTKRYSLLTKKFDAFCSSVRNTYKMANSINYKCDQR